MTCARQGADTRHTWQACRLTAAACPPSRLLPGTPSDERCPRDVFGNAGASTGTEMLACSHPPLPRATELNGAADGRVSPLAGDKARFEVTRAPTNVFLSVYPYGGVWGVRGRGCCSALRCTAACAAAAASAAGLGQNLRRNRGNRENTWVFYRYTRGFPGTPAILPILLIWGPKQPQTRLRAKKLTISTEFSRENREEKRGKSMYSLKRNPAG